MNRDWPKKKLIVLRIAIFMIIGAMSIVLSHASEFFHAYAGLSGDNIGYSASLKYPIGIRTSTGFHELIAAGKELPFTFSETFANALDNQSTVEIDLSQKTAAGLEKIVAVWIEIPPRPKGKANVVITLKIDEKKLLRVKASVMESGAVKEYGPFTVE